MLSLDVPVKPKSERRKFAKDFEIEAVRLSEQAGVNVSEAAAGLGLPENKR
jgi:transposase-like protein